MLLIKLCVIVNKLFVTPVLVKAIVLLLLILKPVFGSCDVFTGETNVDCLVTSYDDNRLR